MSKLRELYQKKGFTQKEFCLAAGISPQRLREIEVGNTAQTPIFVSLVSGILGCSTKDVIEACTK